MQKGLLGFAVGMLVAFGVAWFAVRQTSNKAAEEPVLTQTAATPVPAQAQPAAEPERPAVPEPVAKPAPPERKARPKPAPAPTRASARPPASAEVKTQPAIAPAATPPTPAPPAEPPKTETPQPEPAKKVEILKPDTSPYAPPPAPRQPRTVTLAEGTLLSVRVNETLSSEKNSADDTFTASLEQPLTVDGLVIAERGARVQGRVSEVVRAGKVQGLAQMKIELTQLEMSDGQKVKLQTVPFERTAESSRKQDATKVGIGAAIGAAIGAIAGGGKGAAIGAGAGGAAGAGSVALTRGKPAEIAAETRITFKLAQSVAVTEKLR